MQENVQHGEKKKKKEGNNTCRPVVILAYFCAQPHTAQIVQRLRFTEIMEALSR